MQPQPENDIVYALLGLGALIFLWIFFRILPIGLWVTAHLTGVRMSLIQLALMRFRKVPPGVITNALINGHKAGLILSRDELEAHFMAGGHVQSVVNALISAEKANIPLNFKLATAIDLAGRDVFDAVQLSVNPRVIDTPPVSAVEKSGIQLLVKASETVRTNINQLVGGTGEEKMLARFGEGIVKSIGSAHDHKSV